MNRRELILGASSAFAALGVQASEYPAAGSNHTSLPNHEQWRKLDGEIRTWWDADLIHATEEAIRGDESRALLFLPFPYLRVSASPGGTYYGQFSVDTAFTKYALFAHDRRDIVRDQLLNYLFMIERYGFVLNANMKGLVTRSQTPFFLPPTLWRYYSSTRDLDLLYRAYPLLSKNISTTGMRRITRRRPVWPRTVILAILCCHRSLPLRRKYWTGPRSSAAMCAGACHLPPIPDWSALRVCWRSLQRRWAGARRRMPSPRRPIREPR